MISRLVTAPTAEPLSLTEVKQHLRVDTTDDDTYITGLITVARERVEDISSRATVLQVREVALNDFPDGDNVKLPYAPLRSIVSVVYEDKDYVETTWASTNYFADTFAEPGYLVLDYDSDWPSNVTLLPQNGVRIRYRVGYAIPITANTSSEVITATGHPYADGDVVRVWNSGGALPTGLSADTDYYVRDTVAATSFKLAATAGGTAIDITGAGSGSNFVGEIPANLMHAMKLLIGHWYENREPVLVGTISKELEETLNALLWQNRIYEVPK